MLVEEALRQILAADVDVADVVANRIYPGKLPQTATYPSITYRLIRRESEPVLDSKTTGPVASHYIVYSVAQGTDGYAAVKRLDELVKLAFQGYRATVVLEDTSPEESIRIDGIFEQGSEDLPYDDPTQTYQVASIFAIHHEQEVSA